MGTLQHVVERFFFLARALGEPHEIGGFESPGRRGEDAGARDVVEGLGDQPQISQHVFHQRMIEDREFADDERNFLAGELLDEYVAVGVLAVEHREIAPFAPRRVQALEFAGDPAGFVFFGFQFDDADFFAFFLVRAQNFLGKVRAHCVLRDDLCRYAEDIRRRAVILHQRDAEFRRVLAFAPAGEAFQEKLEAAERSAAEAVDGLVIVADGHDVSFVAREEFQQAELRDVGVLKFVDEDIAVFFLERVA